MVSRSDHDYIARQTANLQEQRTYHTLNLAGLMLIASLFAERVELV